MAELAQTSRGPVKEGTDKASFLQRAVKRFNRAETAEGPNRQLALDDLKFKAGDQWPEEIKASRTIDKRPCLTINKMKTFVHQITNDQRQNRPAINISPNGDKGDKETAKMLKGLIRQIERQSDADIAYDTAYDSAVSCGWGYLRVETDYEDDQSFDQILKISRFRNPFRVYIDPDHQQPDGSDAKWLFITDLMLRAEFKASYPKADEVAWTEGTIGDEFEDSWATETHVRIAEYYCFEAKTKTLVVLANGQTGYREDLDELTKAYIEADPSLVVKEREVEVNELWWYKITAKEILEKTKWLGKWIPVVKVIGDESDIAGEVSYAGLVRDAKDPQRMYNFWPIELDTRIPTPSGWKRMGDIHAGDSVFSEQGKPVNVLAETPVYINRNCYRVSFDDGSHIVADAVHPWRVEERGKRKSATYEWSDKTVTTSELKPGKHFIWAAKPLELPEVELPIHPYLLGVWLGDGTTAETTITQGLQDAEELRANLTSLGHSLSPNRPTSKGRAVIFTVYGVRHEFTKLGLLGSKHIPEIYLRASREQRAWLLKGLMDTDGSIGKSNKLCSFTTISHEIAAGLRELLASLGIKSVSIVRQREARMMPGGYVSEVQPVEQFSFSTGPNDDVFGLIRKRDIQRISNHHQRRTKRHRIVRVEAVASVPVKCITVDSPNHLFLAGESMIPTHNCTSETELIALAPKAPFIMEEGQVEGHEKSWQQANIKSFNYLLYKGTSIAGKPSPPPQRQQFAGPPAGVVQAKIGAAQDMQAVTGIRFDATHQERTYDESGRALRELKQIGDLGNFHYIDNLSRSLRHTGRILVDLIPKIYDTRRMLTILREDGSDELVTIDPAMQQPSQKIKDAHGKVQRLFNPKLGIYDVSVTIGPSFATKRAEAAESMINFLKVVPNAQPLIGDLIAKNMDWPGADEIAERMEIMLPPQLQQKQMENIPAEARGMVSALQQQMQQMKQERDQAVALLGDKDKDRQIEKEKIERDFEAKMAKIAADMEQAKMDMLSAQQIADKAPQQDNEEVRLKSEAAHAKIASDFEAKVMKIFADLEAERMKNAMQEKMSGMEKELQQSRTKKTNS